ncbi:MAG TPA: hypothetical protein PLO63_16955 [Syntrophales bacterium]|nr:hypothetical protein [Syntrophales bacterium]
MQRFPVGETLTKFYLYPSHLYALQARGIVPRSPQRGFLTVKQVKALVDHVQRVRGTVPKEALELLDGLEV